MRCAVCIWFAGLLVAVFGVACRGHRAAPAVVDAGGADSGPVDAGPVGPQAIGGPCGSSSDCDSGICDTQTTPGYCIASCTDNTDCPQGSVCELISGRQYYCVALCTSSSDCQSGYTCEPGADICVPSGGCEMDGGCPAGSSCNSSNGFCSGELGMTSNIGVPCTSDSQCTVGPYPFCIPGSDGFSDGYCSSACNSNGQCGSHNVCVPDLVQSGPGGAVYSACLEGCTSNAQCRAQYNCISFDNQKFCYPFCQTDSDCLENGATCDSTSGLCNGGSSDAGTADAGVDAGPPAADAGEPDAGEADAGEATDAGFVPYDGGYPAPFPAPPQVIDFGGPVLKAPKIVPIFFANDEPTEVAQIANFDETVGASQYWSLVTSEYGVGPATSVAAIQFSEIATGTITDGSIQGWIANEIAMGALPQPDSNTLYVLHYPQWLVVNSGGELSCRAFGGYHSSFTTTGRSIPYAVLPRCNANGDVLDTETAAESHELVEATTDPFPSTEPAYAQVDPDHVQWLLEIGATEVGDMCELNSSSFVRFVGFPYAVQRTWSNAAVAAGRDPCVPEPEGEVYFNAVPVPTDEIPVSNGRGSTVNAMGIAVAPGQSRTIPMQLYSEASTDAWTVQVMDQGASNGSTFTFTLEPSTGQNGDQLSLTITSSDQTPPGTQDVFTIVSTQGSTTHTWYAITGQ